MYAEIKYQVYTRTKKAGDHMTWRYGTEGEAEEQYGYCVCDKKNIVVELQQVIVLKQIP